MVGIVGHADHAVSYDLDILRSIGLNHLVKYFRILCVELASGKIDLPNPRLGDHPGDFIVVVEMSEAISLDAYLRYWIKHVRVSIEGVGSPSLKRLDNCLDLSQTDRRVRTNRPRHRQGLALLDYIRVLLTMEREGAGHGFPAVAPMMQHKLVHPIADRNSNNIGANDEEANLELRNQRPRDWADYPL